MILTSKVSRAAVITAAVVLGHLAGEETYAASVSNGSFEDGLNKPPATFFVGKSAGNTDITGWTAGGNGVEWIGNSYWEAAEGQLSIDLSAGANGSISQEVSDLIVGQTYRISFNLAGNVDGNPTIKQMVASIDGEDFNFAFDITGKSRPIGMGWMLNNLDFRYDGIDPTLTFTNPVNTPYGPAIDGVNISAVPLPGALPMLVSAFGLFAVIFSRKSRREHNAT